MPMIAISKFIELLNAVANENSSSEACKAFHLRGSSDGLLKDILVIQTFCEECFVCFAKKAQQICYSNQFLVAHIEESTTKWVARLPKG